MYPDDHDYAEDLWEPALPVTRRRPAVRVVAAITILALVASASGLLALRIVRTGTLCPDSPVHEVDFRGATDVDAAALLRSPEFRCDGRTVLVQPRYQPCDSRPRGTILAADDVTRGAGGDPVLKITACGGPPDVA